MNPPDDVKKRRYRLLLGVLAAVVALGIAAVVVVLVTRTGGNSGGKSGGGEVKIASDFSRNVSSVTQLRSPSGQPYQVQLDTANTGLEVHDDRLVRANRGSTHVGPKGAPILITPLKQRPSEVSVTYSFTPGSTMTNSVVVGTCDTTFGTSSVQTLVNQRAWIVFATLRHAGRPGVDYVKLAQGRFSTPLRADGTTYTSRMSVDLKTSTVTAHIPDGITKTISNPIVARNWGDRLGVQITRPTPTDGDGQIHSFFALLPKS